MLILLLLSGDVQLNPGPVNPATQLVSRVEPHLGATLASCDKVSAWGFPVDLPSPSNSEVCLINNVHNSSVHDVSTLLGGDSTRSTKASATTLNVSTCRNPAVRKQSVCRIFQTVNHAKVLWDPNVKPRGLFGGHLNIRSIASKNKQLSHLLSNSNLDFLCLSETWLHQLSSPSLWELGEVYLLQGQIYYKSSEKR